MLQTLLAERFAFKAHRETREIDVYALTPVRTDGTPGRGLHRVAVDCETKRLADGSGPGVFDPDARPACGTMISSRRIVAGPVLVTNQYSAITGSGLADAVSGGVGRPVVDRTGLTGTFDVELTYLVETTPVPGLPPAKGPPPEGVSLRDAIKQQLGLELRPERGRVEFLIIDSIERPTPD